MCVTDIYIGCGLGALWCAFIAVWTPRSERLLRVARRVYRKDQPIYSIRFAYPFAYLAASALALVAVAALLPKDIGVWLIDIAVAIGVVMFVASYRPPRRMLPAWFREELDTGRLAPARPGVLDWVLFALVVPICVLGLAALPLLVATGDVVH